MNRRQFVNQSMLAAGAVGMAASSATGDPTSPLLPTVRWGRHEITRLLVGHNPIKGISHQSSALNREMRQWFADDHSRGLEMLRRCEAVGFNACQMGFRASEPFIESLLQGHYGQGGRLQWIATSYTHPQKRDEAKRELARILQMDPPPIGIQQVGNTSDALMVQGQIERSLDNLKLFRDAGLLVGLGSHNHEVIDYAENRGWDLDFYQCCFYRSAFSLRPANRGREMYEEEARTSMTRTIRQVSKPCIAFKVLAAGRHCQTPHGVEDALRFAFDNIKPTDVVLLGMWQKHQDQVSENAAAARRILVA